MIIPIRCFTCGKTLADKYDFYVEEVRKLINASEEAGPSKAAPTDAKDAKEVKSKKDTKKPSTAKPMPLQTVESLKHFDTVRTGPIMDRLGLTRYCCRRHMLTTVDMMETI